MSAIPRAPAHLQAAGRRLWRSVVGAFELRADELPLLEAAARMADEIAALEEALRSAPAMVPGSKGQPRPNPALAEVRSHRLALAKLLGQLGLSDAAGAAASAAGRRLVSFRRA